MQHFMELAIIEAQAAATRGEVPVGAVLVDADGTILASDGNRCVEYNDPSGHAEIITLRTAGELIENYRLLETTLYVTLEPCLMCIGAMINARIKKLVFGAWDPKAGAVESLYAIGSDTRLNHSLLIQGGILADRCGSLLQSFFRTKRRK